MFYGKPMLFFKQIGMCYETILEQGPSYLLAVSIGPGLPKKAQKQSLALPFR